MKVVSGVVISVRWCQSHLGIG